MDRIERQVAPTELDQNGLRQFKQPEGLPEISLGLSEAIPQENV